MGDDQTVGVLDQQDFLVQLVDCEMVVRRSQLDLGKRRLPRYNVMYHRLDPRVHSDHFLLYRLDFLLSKLGPSCDLVLPILELTFLTLWCFGKLGW